MIWSAHDGSGYDLVVVRSTWDYVPRREAFLAWAARCPRLVNPAPVLAWNTDKQYLAELAAAGVAVVPTVYVRPGEVYAPPDFEHVVKPTISAGSRDTGRHRAGAPESAAHVAELQAAGRTAMIQPYIASVDARGETALIFFDGNFSHAICKGPLLELGQPPKPGLFARETITTRTPTARERALAERALAAIPGGKLPYARVDIVDESAVLELELTEPSLFFGADPAAADRFAEVIAAKLVPRNNS